MAVHHNKELFGTQGKTAGMILEKFGKLWNLLSIKRYMAIDGKRSQIIQRLLIKEFTDHNYISC